MPSWYVRGSRPVPRSMTCSVSCDATGLRRSTAYAWCTRAMDMSMADAKMLVHRSPVWADRREGDEYLEDQFWRAAFILCVVQNGQVNQPDELATECREQQQRATTQLQAIAAELPEVALAGYRQHKAHNHRGTALAALIAAGRQHPVPHGSRQDVTAAAATRFLTA